MDLYGDIWSISRYSPPLKTIPYDSHGVKSQISLPCLLSLDLSIVHGLCGGKPHVLFLGGDPGKAQYTFSYFFHMNSNYEIV